MKKSLKPMLLDWLVIAAVEGVDLIRPRRLSEIGRGDMPDEDYERFQKQLVRAEARGWTERESRAGGLVCRLTDLGRLAALGGRDPEARWAREWDGRWRMILFDLPARHQRLRMNLWRWLRRNHFGYLQQSAWIHPDSLAELMPALEEYRDDLESLVVLEGQPLPGYSNAAVVSAAWDFAEINKRYTAYLDGFGRQQALAIASGRGSFAWAGRWLRAERLAWVTATDLDPFLPRALLPPGYRGLEAWQARGRIVRAIRRAFELGQ